MDRNVAAEAEEASASTSVILTACSISCDKQLPILLRREKKYPRIHELTAIKGIENPIIAIEPSARASPTTCIAIALLKKRQIKSVAADKSRERAIPRFKTARASPPAFCARLSLQSRVTAVQMPPDAKDEMKI